MFGRWIALGALVVTFLASPGLALEIGDQAPDLKLRGVVKGEPVKSSLEDLGEVYVVEFWATWCVQCRESYPHLTEMQAKYKDKGVRIVAITDESEELVKEFLGKVGAQMDYTVALDEGTATWDAYATPFGQTGIPFAVVVDKTGAIVWRGHPLNGMDAVLAQVVDGTFDLAAEREKAKKAAMQGELSELTMLWAQEYIVLSRYGRDTAGADAIGKKILESGYDDPTFYGQVAWSLFSSESLKYKDTDFAMKIAQRANELAEGKSADILDTLALALFVTGQKEEAIKTQKQAIALCENEELMKQLEQRLARYEGS